MKDTVRAYQHEQRYNEAVQHVSEYMPAASKDVEHIMAYVESLKNALHVVNRALRDASKMAGSEFWDERGAIDGSLRMIERIEAHGDAAWDALRESRRKHPEQPEVPPNEDAQHQIVRLAGYFDWQFPGSGVAIVDVETGKPLFVAEEDACDKYDCEALAASITAKAPYVILEINSEDE